MDAKADITPAKIGVCFDVLMRVLEGSGLKFISAKSDGGFLSSHALSYQYNADFTTWSCIISLALD